MKLTDKEKQTANYMYTNLCDMITEYPDSKEAILESIYRFYYEPNHHYSNNVSDIAITVYEQYGTAEAKEWARQIKVELGY